MDKTPEIYKNKISKLKTDIQKTYYYHNEEEIKQNNKLKIDKDDIKKINKVDLMKKIDNIFKRNDYVYQANIIIMYKNGESIEKNIVGRKDKYLLTMEGERINIDDIYNIK